MASNSQSSFTKSNIPFCSILVLVSSNSSTHSLLFDSLSISSIHKINDPFPFNSNSSIHCQFLCFFDFVLSTVPSRLAVSSIQFHPCTFNDSLSSTLLPFSSRHPIILQKRRFRKRTCMLEYERIFI
ncbi:hypothetical protein QL285_003823 [Trifolium repens]|nr:hypothetical protein QL285_003823 [Trifolium repens]